MSQRQNDALEAAKIGRDINTSDIPTRLSATNAIADATPAQFKAIRTGIEASIDMKALGLDGFHIDEKHPVITAGIIPAAKSPDHLEHKVPGILFTNGEGQQRVFIANGSEYEMNGNKLGKMVRQADYAK